MRKRRRKLCPKPLTSLFPALTRTQDTCYREGSRASACAPALTPTSAIAIRPLTTLQSPAEAPTFVHPHKARDFWQEKLSSAGGTAASTHYVSLPVSQLQSRSESEEKISKALDGVPGALVEIFKVFSDPGALVELSKALVALKPASEDAKAAPGDSKALVDLSTALVDLKAAPGNYKAAVGNYKAATEKSIALAENFKASTQKRKAFTPKALSFYAKAPLMQEPNFSTLMTSRWVSPLPKHCVKPVSRRGGLSTRRPCKRSMMAMSSLELGS